MTPSDKFQIEQIAPHLSLSWALTEWFHWNQQVNDVLKQDADGTLFTAAYDAVDWEKYYEISVIRKRGQCPCATTSALAQSASS
jgi:hypothetical protein